MSNLMVHEVTTRL